MAHYRSAANARLGAAHSTLGCVGSMTHARPADLSLLPTAVEPEAESVLMRRIRLFAQRRWRCRLFRNNIGLAWVGRAVVGAMGVFIRSPYQVRFGLAIGSCDLIGIASVIVTPQMVGQRVGLFVGAEVKGRRGQCTDAQKSFITMVNELGGRAQAVYSVADMIELMAGVEETGGYGDDTQAT
jgi:hypothetical protein